MITRLRKLTPGLAFISLLGCRPAPVILEGRYQARFELSQFTSCDGSYTAWVSHDTTRDFADSVFARLRRFSNRPDSLVGEIDAFVRFRADTSGPGSFGHLGGWHHLVYVTEIQDLRPIDSVPSCKASPQ